MADKRVADANDEGDLLPQRKRPRIPKIPSWIVEVFRPSEPILRRIVREEVERTIRRFIGGRCMPKQIERPGGRNLELHFRTKLPSTIFTGEEIEGEEGAAIHVVLLDAKTGSCVTSGPEASAQLNVCVLDGDFNKEDDDNWTQDEFENHVVREREGKRPLLTGHLQVSLKEGAGILGRLSFTDNSSWKRSRKFMLCLKVATGCCTATRIREAMTGRFMVKERRVHKKHHPPALGDELWRLECIAKDGPFQKKLNEKGIHTVEVFLARLLRDPQGLRNIIGSGMSDKNWKKLVGHAKAAILSSSSEPYVYHSHETKHVGAIFDTKREFWGLVEGDQFISEECLNHRQKVSADTLVKMAMKFTKSDATTSPQKDPVLDSAGCSSSRGVQDPQLLSQALVPISVQCSDSREGGGFIPIEYDENPAAALPDQPHNAESNTNMQIASTCSSGPQVAGDADNIMTELQAVSDTSEAHQGQSNDGFDDMEAWIRSLMWNPVTQSNPALTDPDPADLYGGLQNSSFSPLWFSGLNVMQNSAQSSARAAAVGWVKVAAALRWAFFFRKKATDRRRAIG